MGQQTQNSHYVSRVVTKAFEADDRKLHYFDLKTETLGSEPSKTLFVQDEPHDDKTELILSRKIEDSIGKYLQRCNKAGGALVDVDVDDRVTRALIALVALQGPRTHQALAPENAKFTLDEMLTNEAVLDRFVDDCQRTYTLVGGTVPRGEFIFFPSVGWFAIPIIDYPPALAVPLSPKTFVALLDRGANTDQLLEMVRTRSMMTAFSMCGGGLEHKIVLPAPIMTQRKKPEERAELVELLKAQRVRGRRLFNLIGRAAKTAGLRAWHYDGGIE